MEVRGECANVHDGWVGEWGIVRSCRCLGGWKTSLSWMGSSCYGSGTPWVAQLRHGNHAILKERGAMARSSDSSPPRLAWNTTSDYALISRVHAIPATVVLPQLQTLGHLTPPCLWPLGFPQWFTKWCYPKPSQTKSATDTRTPTSLPTGSLPTEPCHESHTSDTSCDLCHRSWDFKHIHKILHDEVRHESHGHTTCEEAPSTNRSIAFKTQLHQ